MFFPTACGNEKRRATGPPFPFCQIPGAYGFGAASALAIMSATEAVVIGW